MHWKSALLTLIIFSLGAIAGGLLMGKMAQNRIERLRHQRPPHEAARELQKRPDRTPDRTPDDSQPGAHRHDLRIQQIINKELPLTDTQKTDVKAALHIFREAHSQQREDIRRTARQFSVDLDTKLLTILTPEQVKLYRQAMKKRQENPRHPRPPHQRPHGGPPPPAPDNSSPPPPPHTPQPPQPPAP